MTTANTPPLLGDRALFLKAADHAALALPVGIATSLCTQFQALAELLNGSFGPYADESHLLAMTEQAWEVLMLPVRPAVEDQRVQNVAKALWESDFPPFAHMAWDEVTQDHPGVVARYLELAKAALTADEAEHQRLYKMAMEWHEAWQLVDQERPDEPPAAVVESLASWLVDHNIGIVDEGDGEEGDPVYTSLESMRELAARLLIHAPGMRPAAVASIEASSRMQPMELLESAWRGYYPDKQPDGFLEAVHAALRSEGLLVTGQPHDGAEQ